MGRYRRRGRKSIRILIIKKSGITGEGKGGRKEELGKRKDGWNM